MADVTLLLFPLKPRGEEEEPKTVDSLPHWHNDCDQVMYESDSELCSPQSNHWFPEIAEIPSSNSNIIEQDLDLVIEEDGEDNKDRDGGHSYCNYLKQDQVTLALDLFDQTLHNQINCPTDLDAETISRSEFRVFDIEGADLGLKCISHVGCGLGLDSDSVSGGFGKHEDGNGDYDGDGDVGLMIEDTLSWDESPVFNGDEFFFGCRNFDPVSESGESSSVRNVESLDLINRCGCCPVENDCNCQNYAPRVFGFQSDLDGEEHFATDNKDSGSESNSQANGFGFPLCLEEENGWEDVRIDEREVLSQNQSFFEECMVINDNEEMSYEIHSEQESGNAVSPVDPIRNLDWEVLLQVQDLNISPSDDTIEHDADSYMGDFVYTSEYEVLFGQFAETDDLQKGSLPTSKSFVDKLPSVFLTQEDYDRNISLCAVCMENISKDEPARRLPCLHHYHGPCILPWLSIRNTCPVCRFELPTDDPDCEHWVERNGSPLENDQWRYDFDSLGEQ